MGFTDPIWKFKAWATKGIYNCYRIHARINLDLRMFIDVYSSEPSFTIAGTYGHGQRHVLNMIDIAEGIAACLDAVIDDLDPRRSSTEAKAALQMLEFEFNLLKEGFNEIEASHSKQYPADGEPYPPIGGVLGARE